MSSTSNPSPEPDSPVAPLAAVAPAEAAARIPAQRDAFSAYAEIYALRLESGLGS